MKALRLLIFSIILLPIVSGCDKFRSNIQPGVVLSFDDASIDAWMQADSLLKPYGWKATFFVSNIAVLDNSQIAKLQKLKAEGHEIGGHGFHHVNAISYSKKHGSDGYLYDEINPMIKRMAQYNLLPASFSYPFGDRTASTDKVLFEKFLMLRGTTYGKKSPAKQTCYYDGSQLINGLGLDYSYDHFSIPYFISLLRYAKNHHKIVIFYGHKTVENATGEYETEFKTLEEICQYVQSNHMKFYTTRELYDLSHRRNK